MLAGARLLWFFSDWVEIVEYLDLCCQHAACMAIHYFVKIYWTDGFTAKCLVAEFNQAIWDWTAYE